jgi:hypothetical protein
VLTVATARNRETVIYWLQDMRAINGDATEFALDDGLAQTDVATCNHNRPTMGK